MKTAPRKRSSRARARRRTATVDAPVVASRAAARPSVALGPVDLERVRRLGSLAALLASGYAAAAQHTRDASVALEASRLAQSRRAIVDDVSILLARLSMEPVKERRGRLRWEWLASTARLLGNAPERRILEECVRLEADAMDVASALGSSRPGGRTLAVRGSGACDEDAVGRVVHRTAVGWRVAQGLVPSLPGRARLAAS